MSQKEILLTNDELKKAIASLENWFKGKLPATAKIVIKHWKF